MRFFWALGVLLCTLQLTAQVDTVQQVAPGRSNSALQKQKPYVILISADGFRYDLADRFKATNLQRLRTQGVAAKSMIPAYPSLTFPNHYTIITGLYPSHHGLVDNNFYDRQRHAWYRMGNRQAVQDSSWYGGNPLWVLAEQQQMVTASFYWVGSETAIHGVRPTYYYKYSDSIDINRRIQIVKNWLMLPDDKRPHLITFYMPQVDHEEHYHGVDSKEAEEAVQLVDSVVGALTRMTDSLKLPVNYVFLSDHGMINVDTVHTLPRPAAIDTAKFHMAYSSVLAHLYAKDPKEVLPTYAALKLESDAYDVYLKTQVPAHWHYGTRDDLYNRIGDILVVPKAPKIFKFGSKSPYPGHHGYDTAMPEMHATFYAWGPAFKPGLQIDSFENVHVYPLLAKILGLTITDAVDGSIEVLQPVLK